MSNSLTFGKQFLASFPLIKVRSTDTGETHVVGTNHYDYLYVTEDGTISYVNLQNYGTIGDGYEFVYEHTHLPSTNNTPMFHDADELLASMQGQGLVNLNEGANFLGFLTSSK